MNVSQIADLAEVGLSAVSNWRKRFDDFPRPVASTPGGRDLFELREVEGWLRKRGRLDQTDKAKRLLFDAAGLLRAELTAASMTETLGAALAIAALGRRRAEREGQSWDVGTAVAMAIASDPALEAVLSPLLEIDRRRANEVLALIAEIDEAGLPDCFEWLLTRHGQQQGKAGVGSSPVQTALLAALVEDGGEVVYDPAAGFGGFLLAAWERSEHRPSLFGQEVAADVSRIARQRFLVQGIPVTIAAGDTLVEDAWPDLRADLVICNPPFGVKRSWPAETESDPRWMFGRPPATADLAWIEHCVHHLTENGRAYVFLPPGSLFRGGAEGALRRELVASGAVEAIFGLPRGTALHATIPIALWILRRPGASRDRDSVLLVDAAAGASMGDAEFVASSIPRIAAVLGRWRAGEKVSERDRDVAESVPISELTQGSATLVPARWIHQEPTEAQRKEQKGYFEETLTAALAARRQLDSELEIDVPREPPVAEWIPVKHLIEQGLVEVVKGRRVKAEESVPAGIPVLRTRDLTARSLERAELCHLAPEATPSPAVTKPGDIVLSPGSGTLRALVDRKGGHVLARPLQALRLLDGSMAPEVIAAFLESARNRRFVTGSTYARVSVRDLEIPVLGPQGSESLRVAFEALRDQERLADELTSSARELRQMLVTLASPVAEKAIGSGKGVEWRRSS